MYYFAVTFFLCKKVSAIFKKSVSGRLMLLYVWGPKTLCNCAVVHFSDVPYAKDLDRSAHKLVLNGNRNITINSQEKQMDFSSSTWTSCWTLMGVCCLQVVEGEVAAALSNGAHGVEVHVPAAVHSTSHDVSTGKCSHPSHCVSLYALRQFVDRAVSGFCA